MFTESPSPPYRNNLTPANLPHSRVSNNEVREIMQILRGIKHSPLVRGLWIEPEPEQNQSNQCPQM